MFYALRIYKTHLFPYYKRIQDLNPSKTVLIIEDNVGVHYKARRLLAPLISKLGIQFMDTSANSPDLNPIEHLYSDEKDLLEEFKLTVVGAGQVVQETAELEVEHVWTKNQAFDDCVAKRCSINYLKTLATRSMNSDPPYGNRYKDSM